jgi:hypothetical protein
MIKFNRNALASLGALVALSSISPAHAGPLIIATNIASICKVESDNTVSTVSVTLDTVTANFYGSGLYYHFIPTSGATLSFPSPTSDPKRFVVPAGTYNLHLTTSATYPNPGASTSQFYPITVVAPKVLSMRNGRKFCAAIKLQGGTRVDAIKKF